MIVKKYLFLYPLFVAASVVGMLYITSPKAKAALAGENGPVLYIDSEADPNVVITTKPDGTGEETAASSTDSITAATISDPIPANNYDIVYATETLGTEEPPAVDCGLTAPFSTCAVLNKVTINDNGNPVSSVESVTLDTLLNDDPILDEDVYTNNLVYNLSYSPDSQNVLVAQQALSFKSTSEGDFNNIANASALLIFNTATNTVGAPIVSNDEIDYCLNGGYAQNGAIYYTSCPDEESGVLYYVVPGGTEGTPIVLQGDFVPLFPFFIDVSPDSSQVLIANIGMTGCFYNIMLFESANTSAGNCDYYYVSILDGTSELVSQLSFNSTYKINEDFVPTFFSPDGNYIIGTIYPPENTFLKSVDITIPYTAAFSRSDFSLTALTNTIGVQEWAPVAVIPAATVNPTVKTSAPTLPETGSDSSLILAVALILIAAGESFVVKTYRYNK
jgi:hypothetical protein